MRHSKTIGYASVLVVGLLFGGCTTTTIKPELVAPPAEPYSRVAVGKITAADALWEGRLPFLRRGLVEQLSQDGHFTEILDPAPEQLAPGTVLITGRVTEVEKGNRALRAIIGFGAGRSYASGLFRLYDDDGTELAKFQSRKAYSGGIGIGGWDLLDMDELMEKLGKETGESVGRWVRGEGLEPPKQGG